MTPQKALMTPTPPIASHQVFFTFFSDGPFLYYISINLTRLLLQISFVSESQYDWHLLFIFMFINVAL